MNARRRALRHPVVPGARAPEERVVECIEVGPLDQRGPGRVVGAVVAGHGCGEPGRRLQRTAVADEAFVPRLRDDSGQILDLAWALWQGQNPVGHG